MKKLLLCALVALMALPALAELSGNGYYRVQNAYTKRYAYLLDNTGSYDEQASTADVGALELYLDKERVLSDPSSVFYIEAAPQGKNFYDIYGQGTSIYTFMSEYLTILPTRKPYNDIPSYYMYATKSGLSKYLGDRRAEMDMEKGLASVDCTGDQRVWYIDPLSAASDQYFGALPTVNAQGVDYAPFFAYFPFSTYSEGMKVFVVKDIDARGFAIIEEIKGTVPSATPVIIQCAGAQPTDNRLNIGGSAAAVSGNKLRGVYFDNSSTNHYNRTKFDKESMRVLGVKDGKLAFVESDVEFIPRNQAYLQLTDANQYATKDFIVVTPEEYEAYKVIEVTDITLSATELKLTEGDIATLTATISPGNATDKTVTWTSSDETVVTVSGDGEVTAVKAGSAAVTATSVNGKTAVCNVTVEAKVIEVTDITLSATELKLTEGDIATLTATISPGNATDKTVTWTSSDETVVTVSGDGEVTAVKAGSAAVTATSVNGKTAVCNVTVEAKVPEVIEVTGITLSDKELELKLGESTKLTATVDPSDATDRSVTWSSTDEGVATVDAEGNVTALAVGEAVIAASCGGFSDSCKVTVLPILVETLTVDPTSWSGEEGSEFTITVTVLPENATDKSLTFESSDVTVATVNPEGKVNVLKSGNCVITVSTVDGSGLKAECEILSVAGVDGVFSVDAKVDVYGPDGRLVKTGIAKEDVPSLGKGLYILRSAGATEKIIVR